MKPDDMPDLAGGESTRFLLKEETHRILGCAFEVLNELGHGLYENKITGLRVGLILNFKHPRLEFERMVR